MSSEPEWTLEKMREAYGKNLRAYNEIFPLHPQTTMRREDESENFNQGDQDFLDIFRVKAKKIFPKVKDGADQSGNPVVWRRGDPLDSLSPAMRGRVERALKFGF
jgi:hypothetical protein